ncbi:hypothetical protein L2E82_11661 [Cichorium intybus]|uniref:Uncharacterized protein n=1 Tax=Cichorium intybus TaxID=13427 RepID=A0ACB9GEJ9_CICIN|nr:hypothetical protein L2E82_11661 [Cichorium intybus]
MEIDSEMINFTGEEEDKKKPIVVILVGAPGSGKSTFCDHVMRVSTRPWVRVCQDTIGNGKAGKKAQCLALSNTSLKEGKSILIDRCNLDKEKRSDFINLKNCHQVDIHAIVLDLPAKLCISRSIKRTEHEGNLQGGKAAAVVNRMLQKKESPKINEGFSRITFCYNENDVQSAMDMYGSLSSENTLPGGCFGEKKTDSKVQVGIMKFLKRVDPPSKVTSDKTDKIDKSTPGPSSEGEEEKVPFESGIPTLGFPSISTADFQFNIEKASEIIVEKNQGKLSDSNGVLDRDQKVRREDVDGGIEKNKRFKGFMEESESKTVKKDYGMWAQALYRIAMHPKKHGNVVIEISDDVVVLNETYPKAQKHVLVVARAEGVDRLSDIRKEHLPILRTMHAVGLKWAEIFLKENESLIFRLGYHSEPTMRQLHLHVISQDFDSKYLKKRHWNSFNSSFFRDSVDVMQEVSEDGKAKLNDDEKFMSRELRCNRCRRPHPNIPRLRSHIAICKSPFPDHLLQKVLRTSLANYEFPIRYRTGGEQQTSY